MGLKKDPAHRSTTSREATKDRQFKAGHKDSEETRAKKSASHKGVPLSAEHRAAIAAGRIGYFDAVGRTGTLGRDVGPEYPVWRMAVLERCNFTCQEPGCGKTIPDSWRRTGRSLHAHHIYSWVDFPDLRYDPTNGTALCKKHHDQRHSGNVGFAIPDPELIPCGCGCGELIESVSADGKERFYVNGHARRGKTFSEESRAKISRALKGRKLGPDSAQAIAARNRSATQRAAVSAGSKGKPSPRAGWHNTYMTQDEFIVAYPTMTSREIAEFCHVAESTVCVWAKKLGLPPRYQKAS
jgi:hypothetical protein